MTFQQFMTENQLTKKQVHLFESEKSTYKDTNLNIRFLRLDKAIEGADYIVLSHHAAEAIVNKKKKLTELIAQYDEEFGWGLIMPPTAQEIDIEW